MNKYVKVFTFILVAFLVSISTASAKTLTEVLAQVDAYRAAKNELSEGNKLTDSSVYIIGKHVFTSNHEIKAEELYFAGSTSGTILGKLEDVNLIEVSRKYNADTYEYGDWDLENITTVWGTPDDNYSDNDYTINYIDLEEQDNRTVINTDDSVVSYVGDLNEDNGYFTASLSDDKKTVVVNLLQDVTAINIDEVSQTNIINGLIKLLTNDGDNASVYSKIVLQAGTSTPTEITRADISDAGTLKTKVGTFLKTLMDVTYKDMISQSFNVTFEYDQELYKNDTSNTVYTVKFGKKVDVSKYFKLDNTDDKYYFTTIDGKQVLNIKNTFTVHAEQNAIDNFRGNKKDLEGATLYITWFPCNECAKRIIQNDIKEVVYARMYSDLKTVEAAELMFKKKGVIVRQFGNITTKEDTLKYQKTMFDLIKSFSKN